jgi:hypothetical protein
MKIIKGIKATKVDSSNISKIGYDEESQTLEVHFLNGGVYQYHTVPKSTYLALIEAKSIGGYFFKNIRNDKDISFIKVG